MKGQGLYVDRSALPESDDEEEFYHADLIGLAAETADGQRLGVVRAIYDFGAGDVLDVKPSKGKGHLIPFTLEVVPEIDVDGGRIIVSLPDEMDVHDSSEEAEGVEEARNDRCRICVDGADALPGYVSGAAGHGIVGEGAGDRALVAESGGHS